MQEQLLGNASLNIPDLVSEDLFPTKTPVVFLLLETHTKGIGFQAAPPTRGCKWKWRWKFYNTQASITAGQSEGRD